MYKSNTVHSSDRKAIRNVLKEPAASETELIAPIISEQLLREYILGIGNAGEVFNIYCRAFDKDASQDVRMVILKPSGANEFDEFYFIKGLAQNCIGGENLLLNTIINDFLFLVTTIQDRDALTAALDKIRVSVKNCCGYNVMAVYSKTVSLADTSAAYEHLKSCLGHSFYLDTGRTIYENDIIVNSGDVDLRPDYGEIETAVKSGDTAKIKMLIAAFFKRLKNAAPTPPVAKTYCLELYICIIRCCAVEKIDMYMRGIVHLQEAKSVTEVQRYIEERAAEISSLNAPHTGRVYSSLIRDTINIIDENIENEHLSLRWLAGTILYTNVDYLGKLFKKETGKNFSHYVMEKRMEMAKQLIFEGRKDRIYEIAEDVGYGSNSQYFSQVFKKYTGVSPLEYKEFARLTREKALPENNS